MYYVLSTCRVTGTHTHLHPTLYAGVHEAGGLVDV